MLELVGMDIVRLANTLVFACFETPCSLVVITLVRFGTRAAIITIAKLQHVSHQVFHNRIMAPDVVTANSCVQRNSGLTRPAPITDHVVATLSRTVTNPA